MPPSNAASRDADPAPGLARRLARWRVPLGFLAAPVALLLARPTWRSLALGGAIAAAGELIRLWAAGHLEKGREVTTSGPYRWCAHPLYLGSALMAAGFVAASRMWPVAVLVAAYVLAAMAAAIRSEEAELRRAFGDEYVAYRERRFMPVRRRFSVARAWRNREYRAVGGLAAVWVVLALKTWFGL